MDVNNPPEEHSTQCPSCGKRRLWTGEHKAFNALCRRGNGYICSRCGREQGMLMYIAARIKENREHIDEYMSRKGWNTEPLTVAQLLHSIAGTTFWEARLCAEPEGKALLDSSNALRDEQMALLDRLDKEDDMQPDN